MAIAVRARGVLFSGGRDTLLGVVVGAVACALLILARSLYLQDSWLALVAGREIWQSGVPHHDSLTALTLGHRWVDQQWLSQLTIYALYRVGGLALVSVAHVVLVVGAWGAAAAVGRSRGTTATTQLVILLVGALMVLQPSFVIRTQPYGYPLFVATVAMLSADSRKPSRRVYWTLPIVALWANVHGSAALGAGLVALRGLTMVGERRREGLILVFGAPLGLLLTPYGFACVGYYRDTILNPAFTSLVSEWRPVTDAKPIAAATFLLIGGAIWSFGRHPRRLTVWERLTLLVLFAGGIMVLRNVVWVAFALLMLPAISLGQAGEGIPARAGLNRLLAMTVSVGILAAIVLDLARADSQFERDYPAQVADTIRQKAAADSSLKVFADLKFADWLLWRDPALRGRVAFDARLELQSSKQLDRIVRTLTATGIDWKAAARGFRLIVVAPEQVKEAVRGFRAEAGSRTLIDKTDAVVLLRSRTAAG